MHPEVVSVFPNEVNELHTTRSWGFLGLEESDGKIPTDSLWQKARFGEDVIIANLDTGNFPPLSGLPFDHFGFDLMVC